MHIEERLNEGIICKWAINRSLKIHFDASYSTALLDFLFLFYIPCSADHEGAGLATNTVIVKNNNQKV